MILCDLCCKLPFIIRPRRVRPPGRTAENRNDFRIFHRKTRLFATCGGVILFQNHWRVRDAAPYEGVYCWNNKLQFEFPKLPNNGLIILEYVV